MRYLGKITELSIAILTICCLASGGAAQSLEQAFPLKPKKINEKLTEALRARLAQEHIAPHFRKQVFVKGNLLKKYIFWAK